MYSQSGVITELDHYFTEYKNTIEPGFVVGVIQDGTFIYKNAFGLASIENNVLLTTTHRFRIASLSKQFTAACIFLLADLNKISLSDDIRKYLKDFPDYGHKITIANLIYHTSGLRDYTLLHYLQGHDDDYLYSESNLYKLIKQQTELEFKPGTNFNYSNTGYYLLSRVVKNVTGKTLREFAQENLFLPLEMKNTFFLDNHKEVITNRAFGYNKSKDGFEILMSQNDIVGDGGVITTLDDLYKWDQHFYSNKFKLPTYNKLMITPGNLLDGTSTSYAGGLYIRTYKGLQLQTHSGYYGGYKSIIMRFPEQKTSIILFTNNSSISPVRMGQKIVNIVLKDVLKESQNKSRKSRPGGTFVPVEVGSMTKSMLGKFYCEEINTVYEFINKGDKLFVNINGLKQYPVSQLNNEYYIDGLFKIVILNPEKTKDVLKFKLNYELTTGFLFEKRLN
ncbi:MAG: beta-lactamase family protein [Pseudomonadales bacterium]|nr:beta-lactamase family protein [Pseudomonadales bacterium]